MAEPEHARTTTTFLDGLRDPANQAVWARFEARYRRMLLAFARKLGVPDSDADDIAQETIAEFVREYRRGTYDPGRGRLSSWIQGIAHNRVRAFFREREKAADRRGDSVIERLPDDATVSHVWQLEDERFRFERAVESIRTDSRTDPRTLRAFELKELRGMDAEEVARACGMKGADEVYVAVSRMKKRIREAAEKLIDDVETG